MSLAEYRRRAFARPQQPKFPAARRWPTHWAPIEGELALLAKWMVWKGHAADECAARVMITKVFSAFMRGKLQSANAETEVELLDALDRAYEAAPEIMRLLAAMATQSRPLGLD
jgi:hypothetical protein